MGTDAELFEQIRQGDSAALDELLRRYEATIMRYGIRICGDTESARDVLQETMLSVAEHAEDFREDAEFTTWLWTVARRRCFRLRRRKAGEPPSLEDLHAIELEDPSDDPGRVELGMTLLAALRSLVADDQEVIFVRDILGQTTPEAAKTLSLGPEAVKSRLHRARRRLREALAGPKESREAESN